MLLAAGPTSWLHTGWYATLPFWPLLGAILVGLMIALRRKPERAFWPVVLGVGVSAALGILLFFDLGQGFESHHADNTRALAHCPATRRSSGPQHADPTYTVYKWMSFGDKTSVQDGRWMSVNFYFDGLTGVMLLYVTIVSLMVVIYSIGYMRDHHGHPELGYERFFAFLGLFVFSMCMLVLAGNFVLLYLGWEAVGLCSYLLIGFYYKKPRRPPRRRRPSWSTASATSASPSASSRCTCSACRAWWGR